MRVIALILTLTVLIGSFAAAPAAAARAEAEVLRERQALFMRMEAVTGVPWEYLAAADQWERSIQAVRRDLPKRDGLVALHIPPHAWAGPLNPNPSDTDPRTVTFFGGMGRDANGDGRADPNDPEDVAYAFARYLASYGLSDDDIRIALWEHYGSDRTVRRIEQFARLIRAFGTLDLHQKAFPIPHGFRYTYTSTWGSTRGWGGVRIHEGTDIFAAYGTPVVSTCYGIIEVMGWNPYGGWRIGIRDLNNTYHYFAHLSAFQKGLRVGDIVKPGQRIGYVGSSGYGRPGTSGKFPPHLHFGLYKDNGRTEWSFDPYPYLKRWERESHAKGKGRR
ncbi:L-Ala--D-Glu endopeptidase [Calditerricola yamamurae]